MVKSVGELWEIFTNISFCLFSIFKIIDFAVKNINFFSDDICRKFLLVYI